MKMENIIVRKGRLGDEKGIAEMTLEGFKRKNFLYTGRNKPFTKEKIKNVRKNFASKNPDNISFVAIDKDTNKLVGSTMFIFRKSGRLRHRVDFGWAVHPDYQKLGIATKLVKAGLVYAKKKGFKRAEAEVAVENNASIKLVKKVGFEIEGRRKKGMILDNGKYIDTIIVGKLL